MKKLMIKVLTILIMLLMAFEADGLENSMWVMPEDASNAVMKEAEMSTLQQRRRSRRRRSRQRTRSKQKSQDTVVTTPENETIDIVETVETVIIEEQVTEPKEELVALDFLIANYVVQDKSVISGIAGSKKLTIADKATVILNGLDITNIPNQVAYDYAGITCEGDATIILEEGTTNKVMGGYENRPGIYVPEGKTLTIKGSGILECSSQGWAAGIGGGKDLICGNIVIEEGVIIATGGKNAAAIGSGWFGSCGNIVIRPNVTNVTLIRHKSGGNTIGAGKDATCGTVTIAEGAHVTEE